MDIEQNTKKKKKRSVAAAGKMFPSQKKGTSERGSRNERVDLRVER